MIVHVLVSRVSDNRIYWLESDGDALVVDPIDAEQVVAFARERAPRRLRILTTHGHGDHQGGNAAVAEALGCEVLGPADEPDFPVACDLGLRAGDAVELGDRRFDVLHVPGHTRGHIALHTPGWLVSGDVVFFAGAGTCRFGGDPPVLFETFHRRLAALPDDTVYLPGHDYAARNLAFQYALGRASDALLAARDAVAQGASLGPGAWTPGALPHTLGWERRNSAFFRAGDPIVQGRVEALRPGTLADAATDEERARATFVGLRALRDTYPEWSAS